MTAGNVQGFGCAVSPLIRRRDCPAPPIAPGGAFFFFLPMLRVFIVVVVPFFVVYAILTNHNKGRRRGMQFVPPFEIDPDARDTGAESGDIAKALATLVQEQRAVLLLVMLEALSYREVAEVQGVPIGTVMSRLARARAHARAVLEGECPALQQVKLSEREETTTMIDQKIPAT